MSYDLKLHSLAQTFGLDPIDQVAFLVRDMDRAAQIYGALFGTFHVFDVELTGSTYRGKPASPKLRVGFVNHGDIEIELIQHVSGDGPYAERLEKHGEGLFHVRFPVKDYDEAARRLEKAGLNQYFVTGVDQVKVGYFESSALMESTVVELLSGPGDDLRHATLLGV